MSAVATTTIPPTNADDKRPAGVSFDRIRQQRAHEYVAEQIRRHISLRLVSPGKALPSERDLARQFGVGRPTIQLALRLLEAEHLLEVRRGRTGGTFVSQPARNEEAAAELVARAMRGRDEIEELLEYRGAVEPIVARLAAQRRRQPDLRAMRLQVRGMQTAATEGDYMRHDTQLHFAVAAATRNRFLTRAVEDTRTGLNDVISLLPESEVWHARIEDEHGELIAAIERRDGDAAEQAMHEHIANSEQGVRAVLAAIGRRRRTR